MKLPPNLTYEEVMEAAEEQMFGTENIGFCMACGEQHDACEPDACNYECTECGERQVFGASEIIMRIG